MLSIVDDAPIILPSGFRLEIADVLDATDAVNARLRALTQTTSSIAFNIFEVLDFRMMSGMVGESLVAALTQTVPELDKNPNIDGYPDLMDVSKDSFRNDVTRWRKGDMGQFVAYPHGGVEVKNTFGTKKGGTELSPGEQRIERINRKLDWKAHHRTTNFLLAALSDFIDSSPQIVGVLYSDDLTVDDWNEKQNPREGSTMTSFSTVRASGVEKLRQGLKVCRNEPAYRKFLRHS